jgi:phosphatidylglycerol:prolipoprotein diacylglycerol transferase
MFPTLISLGSVSLTSFGVVTMVALILGAFVVWWTARDRGVPDEKIFDLILVTGALALIGARLVFVITHWDLFSPNLLRVFLIWKFPGLSAWGAVLATFGVATLFAGRLKLSPALIFDCFGLSFPAVLLFESLAVFLDGSIVGSETTALVGLPVIGFPGLRHPIGLYAVALALVSGVIIYILQLAITKKKLKRGIVGWTALTSFALTQFILAFFRSDLLYFAGFAVELYGGAAVALATLVPIAILLDVPKLVISQGRRFREK